VSVSPAPVKRDWLELGTWRILAAWRSQLPGRRWFQVGFATVLAGACLLRAYVGMNGIHVHTCDSFVLLDGAWRVLHGQHPNIDFFSDLGPCMFLMTAFGLKLAHGSAAGFGWVQGLTGAVLGVWAYFLARRRLDPLPRVLFCGTIVFLALSPYHIGDGIRETTVATVYNRFGYCLTGLAMLEGALAAEPDSTVAEFAGGFSTGFSTGVLFFLKITYFLWMFPLALLLLPCRPQKRQRWIGIAAGLCVGFLPFLLYDRGNLLPMLRDLHLLSGAKHIDWGWHVYQALYFSVAPMLLFILMAVSLLWTDGARGRWVLHPALVGCATVAGGYLLLLTNFQFDLMPLNAIGAILILAYLFSRRATSSADVQRAMVTLWGIWLILIPVTLDGAGLLWAGASTFRFAHNNWWHFQSPRLAGISSLERDYIEFVDDGVRLLEQHRRPGDTVMAMDFSNPFSFALGMSPARGGSTGFQFNTNFDDRHHASAEWLFGGATLIMDPITATNGSLWESMPRIFGPYIAANYHLIAESDQWRLYRRKD
jgi:hypothetical protein